MAVRKVIAPAANEPVVMPDGSVNPNWYLLFKFIETLNPLSDYDTSSIDAAIALVMACDRAMARAERPHVDVWAEWE